MQDDKLKQAFIKAIKHYFEDNDFEETSKLKEGGHKFNKKYFDTLEEELTTPPEETKKKKTNKRK